MPWDDDIDLVMPRRDYDIFIRTFNEYNTRYKVLSFEEDKKYPYVFAKVIDTETLLEEDVQDCYTLGVFVDIFPLDKYPNKAHRIWFQSLILLQRVISGKVAKFTPTKQSFLRNLIHLGVKTIPVKRIVLQNLFIKLIKRFNKREELPYRDLSQPRFKCVYPKDSFNNVELVPFENFHFLILSNSDEILTKIYGDYNKLPPKEKRISHHSFRAYSRT
nr:LicD family protein [Porphyromonas macacae]